MKPVGLDRSAHRTLPVRGRAAAAGHAGRRSLQPGRLPDADQMGRAGARAADDSRARAGRVRALRHGAPQHLHQRADGAAADTWQTRHRADLFFAGQVSGVEGYVESAASGLLAGRNAAALAQGEPPRAPPRTTAIGALAYYVSHADPAHYQPSNITHGIMPPLDEPAARQGAQEGAGRRARARRAAGLARRRRAERPVTPWPPARVTVSPRAGGACCRAAIRGRAREPSRSPQGVPRLPRAQPQRLAAHRSRLRQRRLAVPGVASPPTATRKMSRAATGRPRRRQRCARSSPSSTGPGRRAPRWRASSRRVRDVRALPAPRGHHRRRSDGAPPSRRSATRRMPAHLSESEMTRAARGARRRRRRSAAAIARSSSCSTPRACA